ncbi:MAG TPA: hypothetical protein RMH99_13610 [Sandaracinaceae bacterium LLY-WYZ-13_1]|nr:hypothetical protein [Sandaracinaceae bacterium LLY-WYZ-13_1]
MARRPVPALLALLLSLPAAAHAQLLDRASSTVRGSDDDGGSSGQSGSYDSDDDDYGSDDDGGLLGSASAAVRGSSSGGSSGRASSGGSSGRARVRHGGGLGASLTGFVLGPCPYGTADGGYSVPARDARGRTRFSRTAIRVEGELGWALGGAARAGVSARLQLPFAVDLASRYSLFVEPLDDGGVQVAALGRVGVEVRVLDVPAMQLRLGAGMRHFQDSAGGLFGADVLLGLDVFPGEPVILSGEAGVGAVGEAMVALARARLGVIVDSTEIYGGYHYEGLIAGEQHVDLGGPMVGVRAWL